MYRLFFDRSKFKWRGPNIREILKLTMPHQKLLLSASAKGDHDQMHFVDHNNQKVPVQIKALNERARAMSKAKAQASARQPTLSKAASASGAQTRANVQKALFTKRSDKDKTGETPPPKQARQDQQHP
jgi:hypothetical protein